METKIREIIKPGKSLGRPELERLKQLWTETYLGLMLIMSRRENKALEYMKEKLAEANEAVMGFLDNELKRLK